MRALPLGRIAKGAGTVVLCLVALDLVATVVTIAVGARFAGRLGEAKAIAKAEAEAFGAKAQR